MEELEQMSSVADSCLVVVRRQLRIICFTEKMSNATRLYLGKKKNLKGQLPYEDTSILHRLEWAKCHNLAFDTLPFLSLNKHLWFLKIIIMYRTQKC